MFFALRRIGQKSLYFNEFNHHSTNSFGSLFLTPYVCIVIELKITNEKVSL
jgi:hypothetical protein